MTEKQAVSDLKAELAKVKGEARLAREAAEKAVAASYDRGVKDTEVRLAEGGCCMQGIHYPVLGCSLGPGDSPSGFRS